LLIVSSQFNLVESTYGMDISAACTGIDWNCLVSNGYTFAIIQTWQGGYQFNSNIGSCVSGAWNAGMKHVDIYAFMCPLCDGNNPASSAISAISQGISGVDFGMLWIDVEQCEGCWNNDDASNCAYVAEAASAATSAGFNVGIYSSEGSWASTVGDCTSVSNYPLWYAHYDGEANFDDSWAYEFGGWTSPAMKQFSGDATVCGDDIDQDWYPDSLSFPPVMTYNITRNGKTGVKIQL